MTSNLQLCCQSVTLLLLPYNRWCEIQSGAVQGISWCALGRILDLWSGEIVPCVSRVLLPKHDASIQILLQLIGVYIIERKVSQNVVGFQNGQTGCHDDDRSGQPASRRQMSLQRWEGGGGWNVGRNWFSKTYKLQSSQNRSGGGGINSNILKKWNVFLWVVASPTEVFVVRRSL